MGYIKKTLQLFDNYVVARLRNKPSTAMFWYLSEPPNIKNASDLSSYTRSKTPFYLIDYTKKLNYTLQNKEGIIVLPYSESIGLQVNPEAAFQYALGLHDQYCKTKDIQYLNKFWQYVNYFMSKQSADGLWAYEFDWYGSQSPWYSALAQGRGASVFLRAWLLSKNDIYLTAAKNALLKFTCKTTEGGFLHQFAPTQCLYFEEYPKTPTGVINGFMASLMSIWELKHWLKEPWLTELWEMGMKSLESMLPYYTTGWWSLYDRDSAISIANINSPRYHLLEIYYLQILSILSGSLILARTCSERQEQYKNQFLKIKAFILKIRKKILYR